MKNDMGSHFASSTKRKFADETDKNIRTRHTRICGHDRYESADEIDANMRTRQIRICGRNIYEYADKTYTNMRTRHIRIWGSTLGRRLIFVLLLLLIFIGHDSNSGARLLQRRLQQLGKHVDHHGYESQAEEEIDRGRHEVLRVFRNDVAETNGPV